MANATSASLHKTNNALINHAKETLYSYHCNWGTCRALLNSWKAFEKVCYSNYMEPFLFVPSLDLVQGQCQEACCCCCHCWCPVCFQQTYRTLAVAKRLSVTCFDPSLIHMHFLKFWQLLCRISAFLQCFSAALNWSALTFSSWSIAYQASLKARTCKNMDKYQTVNCTDCFHSLVFTFVHGKHALLGYPSLLGRSFISTLQHSIYLVYSWYALWKVWPFSYNFYIIHWHLCCCS